MHLTYRGHMSSLQRPRVQMWLGSICCISLPLPVKSSSVLSNEDSWNPPKIQPRILSWICLRPFPCHGFYIGFPRFQSGVFWVREELLVQPLGISSILPRPDHWERRKSRPPPVTAPLFACWNVRWLAGILFQCIKEAKPSLWTENGV